MSPPICYNGFLEPTWGRIRFFCQVQQLVSTIVLGKCHRDLSHRERSPLDGGKKVRESPQDHLNSGFGILIWPDCLFSAPSCGNDWSISRSIFCNWVVKLPTSWLFRNASVFGMQIWRFVCSRRSGSDEQWLKNPWLFTPERRFHWTTSITLNNYVVFIHIYIYICIPRAPMTSIFEGHPLAKTRVIWVQGLYTYFFYYYFYYIYLQLCYTICDMGCIILHHDSPPKKGNRSQERPKPAENLDRLHHRP